MLLFSQFFIESAGRDRLMHTVGQLIPAYQKHFQQNPISASPHVRLPHPPARQSKKLGIPDIGKINLTITQIARNNSVISLPYDPSQRGHPKNIKHAVAGSLAMTLAAIKHIHQKSPDHQFSWVASSSNSHGVPSKALDNLYTGLINHINSPNPHPNLAQFEGEIKPTNGNGTEYIIRRNSK